MNLVGFDIDANVAHLILEAVGLGLIGVGAALLILGAADVGLIVAGAGFLMFGAVDVGLGGLYVSIPPGGRLQAAVVGGGLALIGAGLLLGISRLVRRIRDRT